ncbi:hypothetical protein C8Q70DRAFT_930940 [Cubamyces menziesii]|nr:hypothetical protein C8Q70DRAFT_930940 [Cubamyces menziesii]
MSPAATIGHNIDPASMIDSKYHQPQVVRMVKTPLTYGVIDHFINTVTFMVAYLVYGVVDKRVAKLKTAATMKILTDFIDNARLGTPAVLVALVYLQRIEQDLQIDHSAWVCERLAIGALIAAFKYTTDLSVKAEHWARCSQVFSKSDIMRIEREFLALLSFEMRVTDADLLALHDEFMLTVYPNADGARTTAVFEHPECEVHHYAIHPHHANAPSPHLPDLMYPDSPADSEDTPPVITPPNASGRWFSKTTAPTHNPYLAPQRPSAAVATQPTTRRGADPARMDTEMEARLRWYSVVDSDPNSPPPASSPRFEPFSPPTTRYVRPAAQNVPWRSYQWPSGTRYDVWGPSGLFKI